MTSTARIVSLLVSIALVMGLLPGALLAQDEAAEVPQQPTTTERVRAAIVDAAARLGGDAWAAHSYVREHIAFEPYEGILKGALGTYLTASGNGVDQALLLTSLVRLADPDARVRFASCAVDAEVTGARTTAAMTSAATEPQLIDQVDDIADQIADPEMAEAFRELGRRRAAIQVESSRGAAELATALEEAGYPWETDLGQSRNVATTHLWPQAEIHGGWVDLDPTSALGTPPCTATETYEELPGEIEHRMEMTVSAEERAAGQLSERILLKIELPTRDLSTARMALVFGEPSGLVDSDSDAGFGLNPDPDAGVATYSPVLRIDEDTFEGEGIRLPAPSSFIGDEVDDALGGALGLFDELPVGDENASGTATDGLSAVWLDITLRAPDGLTTQLRSVVLDRIGPVARANDTAATAELEPLLEVAGDYAALSALWQIGLLLGETVAPEGALDPRLDAFTLDGLSGRLDAILRTFPAVRRDLGAVTGAPAIVLAGAIPQEADDGSTLNTLVFDALHVPSWSPADTTMAARDAQAVVGAEQMLAAFVGDTAEGGDDVAAVLAAATAAGTPLTLHAPGEVVAVSGASARALTRMQASLDAGNRLLAPSVAPVLAGEAVMAWWAVDPATGLVRDEHENGRHTAQVEYGSQLPRATSPMARLRSLGCSLVRPVALAATLIFLAAPVTAGAIAGGAARAVVVAAEREAERRAQQEALRGAVCAGTGGA